MVPDVMYVREPRSISLYKGHAQAGRDQPCEAALCLCFDDHGPRRCGVELLVTHLMEAPRQTLSLRSIALQRRRSQNLFGPSWRTWHLTPSRPSCSRRARLVLRRSALRGQSRRSSPRPRQLPRLRQSIITVARWPLRPPAAAARAI